MTRGSISKEVKQGRQHRDKLGIPNSVYVAWRTHRQNALKRGILFEFTLPEWTDWWNLELAKIGPDAKRGTGKGLYMMCRFYDTGPYKLGNVYCGTAKNNQSDSKRPRGTWLHNLALTKEHPFAKAIFTPKGKFASLKLAAIAFNTSPARIFYHLKKKTPGWSYEEEPPLDRKPFLIDYNFEWEKQEKPVMTPYGPFNSMTEAAISLGVTRQAIGYRIKRSNQGWFFIKTGKNLMASIIHERKSLIKG